MNALGVALLVAVMAAPGPGDGTQPGSYSLCASARCSSDATLPSAAPPKAPNDAEFVAPLVPRRGVVGGSLRSAARTEPSEGQQDRRALGFLGGWARRAGEATAIGAWALGQFVTSGRWTGETVQSFERDTRNNRTDLEAFAFARSSLRGGVSLRNPSLVLGPRLLVGSVGLDFSLNRDTFSAGGQASPGIGRVVGYDFSTTVLPNRNYSVALFAGRSRTVSPRMFGTAREQLTSRRGAVIRLGGPFLDSTITWTRMSFEAEARTDRDTSRDGEDRSILVYAGTRYTPRHNLAVEHRRENRTDLIFPELSAPTQVTALRYGFVLDPRTSGRSLVTTLGFNRRGGTLRRDHFKARMRLDYQLTPALDTRTAYLVERVDVGTNGRERRNLDFRVQHRLYESLVTTFELKGAVENLRTGNRKVSGWSILFEYRKKLVADGRLSMTFGRRHDREDNRFGQLDDLVLGEAHEARVGAPFRLDQPRVIPGTLIVSDTSESIIFQEGFDYTVEFIGEFAEISILPAGRIEDGRPVLVDYQVQVTPFTSIHSGNQRFGIGVDYGWVSPYLRFDRANRDLLSGSDDGSVFGRRARTAGVRFRWSGRKFRIALRNEHRTDARRNLFFTSLQFGQVVSYSFRPGRVATLSLDQVVTDFRVPERRESRGSAQANLRWQVTPVLSVQALGVARLRRDSLGFDENFYQAGIDARWERDILNLSVSITRDWGDRSGQPFSGFRVSIRTSRSF